jgi:hypothetical protein
MMNNTNYSITRRQGLWAVSLLVFAFMMTQPDKSLAQCTCPWVTNGNNINNTNTGNVGIGTTDPLSYMKLHVVGPILSSGPLASHVFLDRTSGRFWAWYGTGDITRLWNGSNDIIGITPAGNVGIGTTSPLTVLHVETESSAAYRGILAGQHSTDAVASSIWLRKSRGTIASPAVVMQDDSISNLFSEAYDGASYVSGGRIRFSVDGPVTAGSVPTSIQFSTGTSGKGLERMRITSAGMIGIGTTSPAFLLDIQSGQINASGGLCIAGDCKTAWSQVGGGSPAWSTSGSNVYYNGGNVGVGTTAPSSKLHVVGDVTLTGTGNVSASGTITAGNIVAKYQDIAEWVSARQTMPAGTVVVLDTEKTNQVVASQLAYDTRVAGVVSDSPGVILGESGEGKVKVATTGRVKVKVDATRAPIRVGDLLVTSDKQGIAMKSEPLNLGGALIHRPGTLIGKALEPIAKGVGEILVLLSLQ